MRLLDAIKRPALAIVGSSEKPSRERLRAAIADRDAAQQAVHKARETLERMETVIKASYDASRAAAKAVQLAKEARQRWVQNGCKYSETHEVQALADAAKDAAQSAERAAVDANVVSVELSRAEETVRSMESDVRRCELRVGAAISVILAEQASPLFERFEHLAKEYVSARFELKSLERALESGRYEYDEGARVVETAYVRAKIQSWDSEREAARSHERFRGSGRDEDAELEKSVAVWRARAALLRQDPDAE